MHGMNEEIVVMESQERGASVDSRVIDAGDSRRFAKGASVFIDITAVSGSPSITVTIQGRDPASGKFLNILESSALSGVGTTVLTVYPGIAETANESANTVLPRKWRVSVSAGNADLITYSVGAVLIG